MLCRLVNADKLIDVVDEGENVLISEVNDDAEKLAVILFALLAVGEENDVRVAEAKAVTVFNAVKIAVFDDVTEADADTEDNDENDVSTVIEVLNVPIGESVTTAVGDGVSVKSAGLAVEMSVVRADALADPDEITLKLISVLALVLGEIDNVLRGVTDKRGLFDCVAIAVSAEETEAQDDTIADLDVLELIEGCNDDDLDDNGEIDN